MSITTKSRPATVRTAPPPRRAILLAAAVAVAVAAVTAGVLFSGAAEATALLDPGVVVRWGLPLATVCVHLTGMVTLGGLTLCGVVLRHGTTAWQRAADISAVAAVAWALLQGMHLVLTHASVLGVPIGGPGYLGQLVEFLTGIELGTILAWAVVLTAVTAVLAVLSSTPAGARWAAIAAGLALMPLAGLGHAGGAGNHELAVSAMWLHLLGIGWWAGGLFVLFMATVGTDDGLASAAARFSAIAGWAVAMVIVSGMASAWIRMNSPLELFTTPWGQLLTVKFLAFLFLAVAGWWHRSITVPLLERTDGGRSGPFWRLVIVEVLIMAGVVGVSVALGSSRPPVPQSDLTENAELVALPEPWFAGLVTQSRIDPLFLFLAGAGAWVYVSWVGRLRHRGDAWPVGRTVSWLLAMVLLVWTISGGLGAYAQALFSVHMLQHMMLISVLPIVLALAAPISLALRALPHRCDGTTGPRELLLVLLHSKWAQFFAHPVVAALNVVVSMAVFYFSPLFELALQSHVAHTAMIVHFSLVGYLFTNAVIGVDPGPRRPPYPLRLVMLLPSMVFHTFFGLFLVSASSLLAGDYFTSLELPWVNLVDDQQAGGAVVWAMGEIPALALAVIVAMRWAEHDERTRLRALQRAERRRAQQRAASSLPAPPPTAS